MLGPTASGKSSLAMALAERLGAEIVSVDSMQVYRGMDIGTAKPGPEDMARVRHHLIDTVDPAQAYSVAEFQAAGRSALDDISARARTAVICGGSGLHFRALVDPLEFPPTDAAVRESLEQEPFEDLVAELVAADPGAAKQVDMGNPRRVLRAVEVHRLTGRTPTVRSRSAEATAVKEYRAAVPFTAMGVDPGDLLPARIERRLDAMLDAGWLDEVRGLAGSLGPTAAVAVGYRELLQVEDDVTTARTSVLNATLALAKRQRTFFRRDPRIAWLPWDDQADVRVERAVAALREAGAWTS